MLSGRHLLNACVNTLHGGYLLNVCVRIPAVAGIYVCVRTYCGGYLLNVCVCGGYLLNVCVRTYCGRYLLNVYVRTYCGGCLLNVCVSMHARCEVQVFTKYPTHWDKGQTFSKHLHGSASSGEYGQVGIVPGIY